MYRTVLKFAPVLRPAVLLRKVGVLHCIPIKRKGKTMTHGAGRSCLLVEDEVLVGMDLEDALREAGFDVRWVASAQSALAVLLTDTPDVVVLDVVVRAESCTAVARELKERGIPFLVHSGYPRQGAMTEFHGAPWVGKPADVTRVASALAEVLDASGARACEAAIAAQPSGREAWIGGGRVGPDAYAITRSYSSSATR